MVRLSSVPMSQPGSVVSQSTGFRLRDFQDDRLERESTTSSAYKQRIDSMFDDTRSHVSGYGGGQSFSSASSPLKDGDPEESNTVQARIEKMFDDVSKADNLKHIGCRFPVKCLGSVPLKDKVTSLQGLQEPLRELYLMRKPRESGSIDISRDGLRVKDGLKPFQTIAVWASVQFILRRNLDIVEYAFLPLIADPEAIDKGALFQELASTKGTILENKTGIDHRPIFAVVMRKPGPAKILECHGFLCSCSEDAIVIAANLYQALMTNMQRRHKNTPRNKNGVSYVSTETSSHCGSNVDVLSSSLLSSPNRIDDQSVTKTPSPIKIKIAPKVPMRPPRQKKKSISSSSEGEEIILKSTKYQVVRKNSFNNGNNGRVPSGNGRRTVSESMVTPDIIDRGDILTKIAIPRSQSFLNPGGALNRYSRMQRASDTASPGSPLGFHELFTEFRIQEGLHSLDDILDVIIDANGMSFNDLKPIYKEFLMKLAVTLTKDELYQRSKHIMRRQRKKVERREKRKSNIKKVFKRSVKKLKSAPQKSPNFEFTSVLFPSTGTMKKKKLGYVTTSSSSYGTRRRATRRQSTRRRAPKKIVPSVSEDSDFFSLARNTKKSRDRSSSGYISCSECSFDSEHCTCNNRCYCSKAKSKAVVVCHCDTDSCVESEKCYCKKTANVFEQLKERGFAASESSASSSPTPKELNYIKTKQHSSVKSTKSLEFLQIKPNWNSSRESIYQKRMDVYESLPVIQTGIPKAERRSHSTDNLALDYDLFSRCRQRKVLVVSARDTRGRVIYNKTSDVQKSTPCDALSVKKSAEIAALFHEVKMNQENEVFYNTLEPPPEYFTMKSRNPSDLESSLGYLP